MTVQETARKPVQTEAAARAPAQETARKLADYVARQAQAGAAEALAFARLPGGAIQDNYLLTLDLRGGPMAGRREFVVRSDAPSRIAASLSRPQEFHVLQAAYEAGVAAPRPYWLCTDGSALDQPFYVMARAQGSAAGHAMARGLAPDQARALTRRLGQELGKLHQVRPPDPRLAFLPVPEGSPARARVQTYRAALAAMPGAHPVLEWALNWLDAHAPAGATAALCHGDFRTGNYMTQDGELTAILDWEFAAWSDPYEDLGWLCSPSWRFGKPDKEVGGIGDKTDLFAGYEQASGAAVDPDRVRYWEAMALLRWAVIALQQAQRHISGEQPSLELALTGRMLPEIEFDLLNHIRAIDP